MLAIPHTMTREELRTALEGRFAGRVRFDEPLSKHTSFRIGGPADALAEVDSVAELSDLLRIVSEAGERTFLLGSGTNVLVSDRGVRGVVLHLGRGFHFAEWTIVGDEARVRAGAAMPFKKLVYDAVERGYEGLEFGEGIPGSVGGGLTMNAGAFGGEIGRVVEALEGVAADGRPREVPRADLPFEYRRLTLPEGFIITAVRLHLRRGDPAAIESRVSTAREKRKRNQPLGFPNAGSIFKNPRGAFAGRLLEDVGVKGLAVGGARVSAEHANFIVNAGGATAKDVRALMDEVQRRVFERTGIRLEPELRLVGEW